MNKKLLNTVFILVLTYTTFTPLIYSKGFGTIIDASSPKLPSTGTPMFIQPATNATGSTGNTTSEKKEEEDSGVPTEFPYDTTQGWKDSCKSKFSESYDEVKQCYDCMVRGARSFVRGKPDADVEGFTDNNCLIPNKLNGPTPELGNFSDDKAPTNPFK